MPRAAAGQAATSSFRGRPRGRLRGTISPRRNSSPPQTPHGSRRSSAPARHAIRAGQPRHSVLGELHVHGRLGEEQVWVVGARQRAAAGHPGHHRRGHDRACHLRRSRAARSPRRARILPRTPPCPSWRWCRADASVPSPLVFSSKVSHSSDKTVASHDEGRGPGIRVRGLEGIWPVFLGRFPRRMRTHFTTASCCGDTGRVRVLLGWVGLALSERDVQAGRREAEPKRIGGPVGARAPDHVGCAARLGDHDGCGQGGPRGGPCARVSAWLQAEIKFDTWAPPSTERRLSHGQGKLK